MKESRVVKLMRKIRGYVNEPRRKAILLYDSGKFNQLIACLDLVEDCELAIEWYGDLEQFSFGSGYLQVYGLMQTFVMQQDAVRYLGLSLLGKEVNLIKLFPEIETIRRIRNVTIGHPVENKYKLYTQIVRAEMRPDSIVTLAWHDEKGCDRNTVNLKKLIREQNQCISEVLKGFLNDLKSDEENYKSQFRTDPLIGMIPKSLTYIYEKLYVFDIDGKPQARGSISLINDAFLAIKEKVAERIDHVDKMPAYEYVFNRLGIAISEYKELLERNKAFHKYEPSADFLKKTFEELIRLCQNLDEYFEEE